LGLNKHSIVVNRSGDLDITDSIDKAEAMLDINNLKALKISRMKNRFASIKIRPKVEVTVGDNNDKVFNVDGSKDDISNFQSYLDLLIASGTGNGIIKDADSIMQNVTVAELESIIVQIKQFGLSLYEKKWAKEAEIMNAATIDEVKLINIDLL
jgi:hypothetical protein